MDCVIRLHCGSNNNQTVGQFVVSLKTNIISGLVYTGLHSANCEGDDIEFLDYLHVFLKKSYPSSPNPFTIHGSETLRDALSGCQCRASALGVE
jgi:hypothetical protein